MSRQPLSRLLRISSSKKRSLLQIHIKWTIFNVSYKDCKNTYFCYTYCLSDSFFFISALQWYIVSVWQEPSGKHPWPGSSGKHKETSSLTHAVKPTSPNTPLRSSTTMKTMVIAWRIHFTNPLLKNLKCPEVDPLLVFSHFRPKSFHIKNLVMFLLHRLGEKCCGHCYMNDNNDDIWMIRKG